MLSSLNYAESIEIFSVGFYCLCLPVASPSAMCIVYTAVKQKKSKSKNKNSQHSTHSFILHKPTKKRRKKMADCFLLKGCGQDWLNRLGMTENNCRPYRTKPNAIGGLVKLGTFQVKLQALTIKCSLQWTRHLKDIFSRYFE